MSVVRNTGWNLASALLPTVVSIVSVPLYIHAMGEARYGVIAIVTSLLGYFGLFDFGLSAATAQRIAATPTDDLEGRRQIFWTAATVNLGLGLVGALILLPVAVVFFAQFKAPSEITQEIRAVIGWLALVLPIMLLTGVLRGALQGAGRFAELNLISLVLGPVGQLVPLAVAIWVSPRLGWVLPALYGVRLLQLVVQGIVVVRRVTLGWSPRIDRARIRDLLSFGGWVTLSAVIDPLLTTVDRFVIASRIGVQAVSHYTVPYQLAQRSLILPSALMDALLPRIAAAPAEEAAALTTRGIRATVALLTPAVVAGMIFIHPFLELWISPDFADKASLSAQWMLAGCWANAIGVCCFVHLRAVGRPRSIAVSHLLELVPYLAVLTLGIHLFGLAGAAAAFAFRVFLDNLLLAWFGGLLREVSRITVAVAPVLVLAGWLGAGLPDGGFGTVITTPGLAGVACVGVVGLASLAWLYGQRETLLAALRTRVVPAQA